MGGLTEHERHVAAALAAVAIPRGDFIPEGGPATIARMEASLDELPPWAARGIRALLYTLDVAPLATHRRRFTALSASERAAFLEGWQNARWPQARQILRALLSAIKAAHFDDPALFARVGCPFGTPRDATNPHAGWVR